MIQRSLRERPGLCPRYEQESSASSVLYVSLPCKILLKRRLMGDHSCYNVIFYKWETLPKQFPAVPKIPQLTSGGQSRCLSCVTYIALSTGSANSLASRWVVEKRALFPPAKVAEDAPLRSLCFLVP